MFIKLVKSASLGLAMLVAATWVMPPLMASAADAPAKSAQAKPGKTIEEKAVAVEQVLTSKVGKDGAETCVGCHDAEYPFPTFAVFKTKHGVQADARGPMANQQCESCHGPGGKHLKSKSVDKRGGTIINFGKGAWTPAKDQNAMCLTCHTNHQRIEWKGSSHEFADVACASCHKIHANKDPILDKQTQAQVCLTCHTKERAKFQQPSHHPVKEGKMTCTECHNVHGEQGTGARIKTSQREKCTSCHAEKRGPFLWEHAPAAEDCTICHNPHGSNQPALLKKRPPMLCQECHSALHASYRNDGSKLPGSALLGIKGCVNCHSQVHGSNHPAGSTLFR